MAERGLGAPPHARGAAPAWGCSAPGSWGAHPGSRLQKETIFFFWFCSRIFPACLEKMARHRGCEGAGEVAPVPPHAVFSISILGACGSKGLGHKGKSRGGGRIGLRKDSKGATQQDLQGRGGSGGFSWCGLLSVNPASEGRERGHARCPGANPPRPSAVSPQEYNMYGWWVGELNNTVGIVPKDYLVAAYDLEE